MATPAIAPPSAAPSDRLQRWVGLTFIAVSVILLVASALSLFLHRETALRQGQDRAEALVFILGDHLIRDIAAIDTTLSQLALYVTRLGGAHAPEESLKPFLETARSSTSGVANLSVLDESGVVTHSTLPALIGQSRADTPLFRRLSTDPGAGLATDESLRGRYTGQVIIPLGRRLTGPDGRFAGTVVASFEPERLRQFYRTIALGRRGVIWLMKPDTTVLFREPSPEGATERTIAAPWRAGLADAPASGSLRAPLEPGGGPYVHAFQRTPEPPLLIAVSIPESVMLASWNIDAAITALIVAGFLILLIIAWRLIGREIRQRAGAEGQIVAQSRQLIAALNQRERADAALRASQAQFRSIMDNSPMMVSLRDLDGRFTFVNRAYVQFAGQSEESILGRTFYELRPKEHADLVAAQDRAVIEQRRALQWEMTLPKPDGPRTVLVVKFPVNDEAGKLASLGAIVADITEQKRAEVQIAQAQRIEALGQLTGGIAHDFNNLLTSILLNADVLASVLDDKLRPLAESMRLAAERGADLTRRLLAFGRRQMLEPRPTDIGKLLDRMEPLMHRTLGEHIEIRFQHATDLWSASVDPGQLENAVISLAVNARDAMPGGGRLTIETANVQLDDEQTADTSESKAGQYVMIAVGDTGSGMAPDVVARAFEPFFTTKDVGKGTGLGLSMVYGFVQQSGGQIRIHSELGNGTVVRLYLPRSMVAAGATASVPAASAALPKGTETILFVEDDAMVREHTGRQIVGLGYAVIAAENAVKALSLVDEGYVPDLLFTDVVMPGGVNGRQLALTLRRRWPKLRVLYTSGYAHGRLTIDGESVPSKYVLGKPYRRADLAAKLREVLDEALDEAH